MCTSDRALDILGEVFYLCNPIFDNAVRDAYLYGSYARGDYNSESDVDILLTVNLSPEEIATRRIAVAAVTSDLSLKHNITVSVTVKPSEQFYRFAEVLPFYKNVLSEGIRYAE